MANNTKKKVKEIKKDNEETIIVDEAVVNNKVEDGEIKAGDFVRINDGVNKFCDGRGIHSKLLNDGAYVLRVNENNTVIINVDPQHKHPILSGLLFLKDVKKG